MGIPEAIIHSIEQLPVGKLVVIRIIWTNTVLCCTSSGSDKERRFSLYVILPCVGDHSLSQSINESVSYTLNFFVIQQFTHKNISWAIFWNSLAGWGSQQADMNLLY